LLFNILDGRQPLAAARQASSAQEPAVAGLCAVRLQPRFRTLRFSDNRDGRRWTCLPIGAVQTESIGSSSTEFHLRFCRMLAERWRSGSWHRHGSPWAPLIDHWFKAASPKFHVIFVTA